MGRRTGQGADIVGSQIFFREHGRNAWDLARRVGADRKDAGVRMRRANHGAMKRVWRHEIGDVAPAPPQEALVFKPVDAAP